MIKNNMIKNCKIICNKGDISLSKKEKYFNINFNLKNNNINLNNFLNFKIYELLFELNKDIIEKIEFIDNKINNSLDILLLFHNFGKEFGFKKKYMFIRTLRHNVDNDIVIFKSVNIPYTNEKIKKKYDLMECKLSTLIINIKNHSDVNVNYNFEINIEEELPIYMENLVGILMKKTFHRLKSFIEQIN